MGSSVKGLVVLITGASSGLGQGCAVEFAKHGAKLAITGRNRERLEETADMCIQEGLDKHDIYLTTGDVTVQDDCKRIVDESVDYFNGKLDVLVNNAGEARPRGFDECEIEDLDYCYNALLKSVFMMTKLCLPHLEKTKGAIVNMSSVAGLRPYVQGTPYSTVKCALDRFTQICSSSPSVAGKGVRVNSVNPATVKTAIFTRPGGRADGDPDKMKKWIDWCCSAIPLGRIGEVEEVARLVVFLSSREANFMSGTLFPIDGGYSNTSYIAKPHIQPDAK